jgi:hypothetical protein
MTKTGTRKTGKSRAVSRKRVASAPPSPRTLAFLQNGNMPPGTSARTGRLTRAGLNLARRARFIREELAPNLGRFNRTRGRLGYRNRIGATPVSRSPPRSPPRSFFQRLYNRVFGRR